MIYARLKKLIQNGGYDQTSMQKKLDIFLLADRITDEQYKELNELLSGGENHA